MKKFIFVLLILVSLSFSSNIVCVRDKIPVNLDRVLNYNLNKTAIYFKMDDSNWFSSHYIVWEFNSIEEAKLIFELVNQKLDVEVLI